MKKNVKKNRNFKDFKNTSWGGFGGDSDHGSEVYDPFGSY